MGDIKARLKALEEKQFARKKELRVIYAGTDEQARERKDQARRECPGVDLDFLVIRYIKEAVMK
jgi:hypothetical protein